jgi:eukaryotic-like serine/threonine-protein kinase
LAGGGVVIATRAPASDPCPPPERAVAAVWGPPRQAALRGKLAAIDPAQSAARFAATQRTVEPFVGAWRAMHVESCRANRIDGAQSDTLFDLRIRCLDRRLAELDTSLALLESAADRVQLDNALLGLAKLTPLDGCADAANVAREVALPTGPDRLAAERLAARIQRLQVERRASRLVGLPATARAVVAEARTLAHPPTLAAALAALAQIQLDVDDTATAEATLRELTEVAASAHDDAIEAYAWRSLVVATGYRGKPDEALALLPAARAALLRAGNPLALRVELLYAEAGVLDTTPRVKEAIAKLDEARGLLEEAGATRPGSPWGPRLEAVLFERGTALASAGDHMAAIASYRAAIERERAIYGPDSLDEAMSLHNLGEAARRGGKYDEALAALRESARISRARAGDSARAASTLVSIGSVYLDQRDWPRALAVYDDAIALYRRVLDSKEKLVPVLVGRATVLGRLDRIDEALATYEEVIAIIEHAGITTTNLPIALGNRGELHSRLGRCDRALADYQRSIDLFTKQVGASTARLIQPLVGLGHCLLVLRRPAEAVAPLERANEIRTATSARGARPALAPLFLGRALVEAGRDRARGLALARQGRELLAAASTDKEDLATIAELDRWLAAHR